MRYVLILCLTAMILSGCTVPGETTFELESKSQSMEETISDEPIVEKRVEEKPAEESVKDFPNAEIYVDVSGEVVSPGVYLLEEGARVFQAIEAAGGITEDACMENVNQARRLFDEDRVWIPNRKDLEDHPELLQSEQMHINENNTTKEIENTDRINLNCAGVEELMGLNGIGRSKAEAIVKFREEQGNFQSIEQIMEIDGIKEGTFLKIKDRIYVG